MGLKATIIIPTHDHSSLLAYSIESVLRQSIPDFELFVIGDGVPDATRQLMEVFEKRDARIRFFDHPKGERLGEIYRHQALGEARGEIVCYLCDDDLYLPAHVEYLYGLLQKHEFVHSLPLYISGEEMSVFCGDLAIADYRRLSMQGRNFIPLSCAAHRLSTYRRLPFGWRAAPRDVYSDLYQWQQFFALDNLDAKSAPRCTVLHFPSSLRHHLSSEERIAELKLWSERIALPGFERHIQEVALAFLQRQRAELEFKSSCYHSDLERLKAQLDETQDSLQKTQKTLQETQNTFEEKSQQDYQLIALLDRHLTAAHRTIEGQASELLSLDERLTATRQIIETQNADLSRLRSDCDRLTSLVRSIEDGFTWRLRSRFLNMPLLGKMLLKLRRRVA